MKPSKTSNKDITRLLRSVAAVYLLKDVNRFRIIAYENAADTAEHMNRELYDLWQNGQMQNIAGIGPSISEHLDEYFKKGDNSYLVKTVNKFPPSLFELMRIPGIGPKKAYKLVTNLNLTSEKTVLDELLAKAAKHEIADLDTFGKKSEEDIVAAIKLFYKHLHSQERMPLPYAYRLAQNMIDYLKENKYVKSVDSLGSLRRMVSTIGDIDLAAVCDKSHMQEVVNHFIKFPGKVKIDNQGKEKASIIIANGKRIDLRVSDKESYGAMLQYFTGSKAHNIKLREFALKKGYSLSEYGIKKMEGGKSGKKIKQFKTEEEFYKFLGLSYIPPEIREGTNEIEITQKKQAPQLVQVEDIKGEFHVHSSYDLTPSHDLGRNTYEEILIKADKLNYNYIAFSDHNPSITNQSEEKIIDIMRRRQEYINQKLSKKNTRCKFFISCEVDILPDGKIALPEKALEFVDLIIISVHSSFRINRADQTRRVLKALSYPKVKILGHPTGRLLMKRPEIDVDWRSVFKECVKRDIALEINAWPERLDLPDILVREAKDLGAKFVIDTDAHEISQMDNMFYGVSVARRGWLEKKNVINTVEKESVTNWIFKKNR